MTAPEGRGRMLRTVLQTVAFLRRPHTTAELADAVGVSLRTAYRTIEQLRDAGLKIDEPKPGRYAIARRALDDLMGDLSDGK